MSKNVIIIFRSITVEANGRYHMIDVHTHVLPGIDDGAKDWDICLKMLLLSVNSGIRVVIATPHHTPWARGASPTEIINLCKEAERKLLQEYKVEMRILPGNEIYYSTGTLEALKAGTAMTLAESQYVLIEFEDQASFSTVYRAVRELRDGGYIPILAHIERYQCMYKEENMSRLKKGGALFQMNVEALRGGIFDRRSRWAKRCIQKGLIDFVASDMHNLTTRAPFQQRDLEWLCNKIQPENHEDLLHENGEKILKHMAK